MATADVRRMHQANGRPVVVLGRGNRVMWSEVFEHNPRIARNPQGAQTLINGPGIRPYIMARSETRWTWRRQRAQEAGEIYLTPGEREFGDRHGAGSVLIEPNVKATNGHTNKAWPFERWQAVVHELPEVRFVQCAAGPTRWLDGVTRVETPSFRAAAAVLAASKAFVGTEGALHHAAAAFGVPAVVLWSEFIAPDVTGYVDQHNIRHAGEPCGSRVPCRNCAASMMAISVDEVVDTLGRLVL